MKQHNIRLIVILATLSIIGIVVTQVYWVRKALDIRELQYNQNIFIALQNTAEHLAEYNKSTLPSDGVVNQVSSNYFVVRVNQAIDAGLLEHCLKNEFSALQLPFDFEYGIYDCSTDKMVYGNYIKRDSTLLPSKYQKSELPKWDKFLYYFGVNLPTKANNLVSDMGIWFFSSFMLLVVIVFFGYSLLIIFEQRRLSEIQKDFINNITHEFKTPISTISIAANVLSKPNIVEQPERLLNYANIIKNENERLQSQVEKVLQMARIEKQNLRLNKEKININDLLQEAAQGFLVKIQDAKGSLTEELYANNAFMEADKFHLTNLIYNLLDNAIKYNDKTPSIVLETENEGKFLIFSVIDNGIGIDKSHFKHIFDKFYRVPTGNLHDVKGFGLGLNYVKTIVKAHKWKIVVESKLGESTTFKIYMK